MTRQNIFLVGPMGAGKTTIGKELAKTLGMTFIDSDHEIEQHTGASIPLIFELEGEAGFRTREHALLSELTQRENIVLATGGGAIIDQGNRTNLASRGFVVYLRADVEQLFTRTAKDPHRPLLKTVDPKAKLSELMAARAPLYEEVADLILDTGGHTPKWLVKKIIAAVSN